MYFKHFTTLQSDEIQYHNLQKHLRRTQNNVTLKGI